VSRAPERRRVRLRVEGIVQGVGFRPFVHGVATRLGLAGFVRNDVRGVVVEAEGDADAVARFLVAVQHDAPPMAVIERVATEQVRPVGAVEFVIGASDRNGSRVALVSPDVATCVECLQELADPADRRFRYPFVNCTNCGPRFTIVVDVPAITMSPGRVSTPTCSGWAVAIAGSPRLPTMTGWTNSTATWRASASAKPVPATRSRPPRSKRVAIA